MLIRRLAGLVGIAVSGWMFWKTVHPIMRQISFGSDLMTELFYPPVSFLRLIATSLMILGGLLAVLTARLDAWVFSAGAVLFAAMTALMVTQADPSLWSDEAILAPFLLVIAGVLVFCHRK
ncbi:hypothetical protein [Henriciella aquimarina]|uniref:hypothetical protein n=1 Tax=Henriciella aquimarina TaxID=545261 RepID=UPI000A01918C|nr:hypothetical protein [Henriciella aquimarina]